MLRGVLAGGGVWRQERALSLVIPPLVHPYADLQNKGSGPEGQQMALGEE